MPLKGHKPNGPGSLQNTYAIPQVQPHKYVSRKHNHVEFFTSVLPTADASVDWEKTGQPTVFQMNCYRFFMTWTNRHRIPVLLRQRDFPEPELTSVFPRGPVVV